MIRRAAVALCLAALCLSFAAQAADKLPDVNAVITDAGEIQPVAQSGYVIVKSAGGENWAVFDTQGVQRTDYCLNSLKYLGYGCFSDAAPLETCIDENGAETPLYSDTLNVNALVCASNGYVSPYTYGVLQVLNTNWALGYVVAPADDSDYDYKLNSTTYYRILRCDVFRLGYNAKRVVRLDRDGFSAAAVHGEYLSLADSAGNVMVFDGNFRPTGMKAARVSDSPYVINDYVLMNRLTGEKIMDGCTAFKEYNTENGLYFVFTRVDLSGKKRYGVCTVDGEELMPPGESAVSNLNAGYALLTLDGRFGLYSFGAGLEVVPCDYDSVLTNRQSKDTYASYGYACGVIGGERHFYSLETGDLVLVQDYDALVTDNESASMVGATVCIQKAKAIYDILPADGKSWTMRDVTLAKARFDGSYLVARSFSNRLFGVYTFDGRLALDFKYKYAPVLTDDGHIILKKYNELCDLVELLWEEEE